MSERNLNRISVIIPVGRRREALRDLYDEYRAGLEAARMPYEFVFVMDGPHRDAMAEVEALIDQGQGNIQMVVLFCCFGVLFVFLVGFVCVGGVFFLLLLVFFLF